MKNATPTPEYRPGGAVDYGDNDGDDDDDDNDYNNDDVYLVNRCTIKPLLTYQSGDDAASISISECVTFLNHCSILFRKYGSATLSTQR